MDSISFLPSRDRHPNGERDSNALSASIKFKTFKMNPENTRENINTYLDRARTGIERSDTGTIILGNEAADLDSMVSAVLYGQLVSAGSAVDTSLAVPVINCPRDDYVLRTEAVFLFDMLKINVDALLFIDELNL